LNAIFYYSLQKQRHIISRHQAVYHQQHQTQGVFAFAMMIYKASLDKTHPIEILY